MQCLAHTWPVPADRASPERESVRRYSLEIPSLAARDVAAQRCGYATYAVGNAAASFDQMTRRKKQRCKQTNRLGGDRLWPMKGFLLGTVWMVALTSVARAADVPAKAPIYVPAPVADWTGPYLGVQGGAVRRDV